MMSLRFVALVVVALAGSTLAKEKTSALPIKVTLGQGSYCSGTTISSTQILIPATCVMSGMGMDVKVRPEGIPINDSGEMYRINRIVYHPDRNYMDMSKEYAIVTVDRKIDGGKDFKAAKLAKDDVTIPEGETVTTVRVSTEMPTISYYWQALVYQDLTVVNDAKCKERFPDMWSDSFICVGPANPDTSDPNNQCQGNQGAPLAWNGKIVAVASCELSCYGDLCAYRKISSFQSFIDQNKN
ncbi:vitellin-degrading protease-like [Lutzomyia longipalpis]|uniref:vitellin-degrading protease-like n=1 Tax=Lutzomyia longipalpis TaxID=7200 RepID=UPI0024840A6F|nr:vitellin-degrading protease-like [Lutzomyia longipalpis]